MIQKSCLNCGYKISDEFCPHCGQKSSTARITPNSLITSDILGSIWHIEARFFSTIKHIISGPGKMAMNYIAGKRVRYYNLFSLLLILFGFNVLALHFYMDLSSMDLNKESSKIMDFFSRYSKASLLALIPVMAFNTWMLFRKGNLNFAEHVIIATVGLCGILVILLIDDLVSILQLYDPLIKIMSVLDKILVFSLILFPGFTYFNAFKNLYQALGLIWRTAVFYLLLMIELMLVFIVLYKIF
ncbi:DUF3667 domain-containing protein [Chryseobacterium sp. L7]|uniref:DUF3667 domain-containing protein n=1 Tax=Chryseobacterium endalhagicum TaxID=2797638 RepID=A0ABS1QE77_9FLAO|nr:DUF3667 domain-containing protein [Chryseobacterium endalhagicum]MBL1220911.1 DUF3667 domain-containing protein [Chryseobacterium endalhagicum]